MTTSSTWINARFPPYTGEHEMFRQAVRAFTGREIVPQSDQWDKARYFPDELFRKAGQREIIAKRRIG